MNKLKLPFSIGLICLIIGLISGYKLSPKPTHTVEVKTEIAETIKYVDKQVFVDRVITKYPDGKVVTEEKDRSREQSLDNSLSINQSIKDTTVIDKSHSLLLGLWSDKDIGIGYGYKLYETDKYSLEAIGSIKSNIIDLKNNEYMIGLGIRF